MNDYPNFITYLSITPVWHRLGGGKLRHRRGCAFWRNGDGYNVSIDANKGCWYDHREAHGGGIVDLVRTALGCDRARAIEWLRDYAGVPRQGWTAEERCEYARRRAAAEREARVLTAWREQMTEAVRAYRDLNMRLYHFCVHRIVRGFYDGDAELVALMEEADAAEAGWQRAEKALNGWREATWDEVLVLFRTKRRAA